ncbi:MAG: class I SAM-dependent methyltransferase [Candidatus Paceibacterota bacterium]|jgi:ubiquinone/menaquinone biosynthesis C-methylase UbiE
MKNEVIQDYGKTVTSELYVNALQGHQYIPQADHVIKRIIKKHLKEVAIFGPSIIDAGCGPGRLTFEIAELGPSTVVGVDISESFINYAENKLSELASQHSPYLPFKFTCADFGKKFSYEPDYANIILMQGVMHHIHDEDRDVWLKKCFRLLKSDGILVIGDEFIRDYKDAEERLLFVTEFYCHIIDEARKGGFDELAEEEAKNLVDDAFSDTEYAGYMTQECLGHIYNYARMINEAFYKDGILRFEASNQIRNLFNAICGSLKKMILANQPHHNRGDYKTSVKKFTDELQQYGFVLEEKYEIGPVEQLGGMGVLVFMKR